jgi:hypothetical protein
MGASAMGATRLPTSCRPASTSVRPFRTRRGAASTSSWRDGGASTGDPKLAGLLYDSYYRWGSRKAPRAVRRAFNDTLQRYRSQLIAAGTNPDDLGIPEQLDPKGRPNAEVHDAIMLLLNAGRADALRAAIGKRIGRFQGGKGENDIYRRSVLE